MAIKRPKPEEIVEKLRQVEVMMRQGMPQIDAIRQISVTEQTYYRWIAGGQEKRPVDGFPAKQVQWNGHGAA